MQQVSRVTTLVSRAAAALSPIPRSTTLADTLDTPRSIRRRLETRLGNTWTQRDSIWGEEQRKQRLFNERWIPVGNIY